MIKVRIVDLFAGCGGLSYGFDTFKEELGETPYVTVMGIDNWQPALKILNANTYTPEDSMFPTGRLADLQWYDHASEVLLYYLVHYAYWLPDRDLIEELIDIGFTKFLLALRQLDEAAALELNEFSRTPEYSTAIHKIDKKVYTLASCKSAFTKLHLASLSDLSFALDSLPWREEIVRCLVGTDTIENNQLAQSYVDAVQLGAEKLWDRVINQINSASEVVGRGQHKVNPARMATLATFFDSSVGKAIKGIWSKWYAQRATVREQFCLSTYSKLLKLYNSDRRVHLVLGGPPCKGFSRIGRAVIRELRAQGAHAWACNTFGDERNALMYKYVLFLEALVPDAFLFENVSNFASALKTPDGVLDASALLEELIDDLGCDGLHYHVTHRIVKAKKHGIPQARERFIMCGINSSKGNNSDVGATLMLRSYDHEVPLLYSLTGLDPPSEFVHGEKDITTATKVSVYEISRERRPPAVRDYLRWIHIRHPHLQRGNAETDSHIVRRPRLDDAQLYNLFPPGARWMDMKTPSSKSLVVLRDAIELLVTMVPKKKISRELQKQIFSALDLLDDSLALRLYLEQISADLSEEHHLLTGGYLSNGIGRHGDWLERLSVSKPCKTIVAHIGKDTYGYIHPYESRPISIREAARIQTFPDEFLFAGAGVVDAYTMIGNAVPPLLAHHFAESLWLLSKTTKIFGEDEIPVEQRRAAFMKKQGNLRLEFESA